MRALKIFLVLALLALAGAIAWPKVAPLIAPRAYANGHPKAPTSSIVRFTKVADGLSRPVLLTHAGDGSGRRFIVEQTGTVRVLTKEGTLLSEPFLDVSEKIATGHNEQGLLGLAFHPRFRDNGVFFLAYTRKRGGAHVTERWRVLKETGRAEPTSAEEVLVIDQPAGNHNGGHLAFGPDGMLYIGTGDGGGAGDTFQQSRKNNTLLAKMLRIDVDGGRPYGIPKDNPFVGKAGFRPEIWALGLRNPWRYSFDRKTGDLYIADVGQNRYEEVHFQPASSKGGEDYGWNVLEGSRCYRGVDCERKGLELPIFEYAHEEGCSVTGGYVYRGSKIPALFGRYLVGDYCSGVIWQVYRDEKGWRSEVLAKTPFLISSFGEDEAGEVYVVDHRGAVFRIDPKEG